jgi:hypothetical protein
MVKIQQVEPDNIFDRIFGDGDHSGNMLVKSESSMKHLGNTGIVMMEQDLNLKKNAIN